MCIFRKIFTKTTNKTKTYAFFGMDLVERRMWSTFLSNENTRWSKALLYCSDNRNKKHFARELRKKCKWYFQMVKALYRRVLVVGVLGKADG